MSVVDWLKAGWENYKSRWSTYAGLIVLELAVIILLGVLAVAFLKGAGMAGDLEGFLMAFMFSAPAFILLFALVAIYFDAAIHLTAAEGNGIKHVLKRALERYLSFLGAAILTGLVIGIPTIVVIWLGAILGVQEIFALIALLVALYLVIKLVTVKARVALGDGAIDAVRKALEMPFTQSLTVFAAALVVAVAAIIASLIPLVGALINIFVIGPWGTATIVEATRSLTS